MCTDTRVREPTFPTVSAEGSVRAGKVEEGICMSVCQGVDRCVCSKQRKAHAKVKLGTGGNKPVS